MKHAKWIVGLMVFATFGSTQAMAEELTAKQIVDKMLDRNNSLGFKSGQAQLTLLIKDKTGNKRVRKMTVKSKKFEKQMKTIVKLTEPKEVKGQAFFFAENKSSDDDVWMFLPAFKVTRRIEGSNKKGAFLGSHFTFSDLESRDVKSATYKKLKDEKVGKFDAYVIESIPTKAAKSDYGKVISYVRKSDFMPLKVRFYAKDGKTVAKTMFVEKLDKTAKKQTYIKQMTLRAKSGGFTTIKIEGIDDKAALPAAIFSKDQFSK